MVKRAAILCSNENLYIHTYIALRLRFQKSGYPNSFLWKYMNINEYKNRKLMIDKMNQNRLRKVNESIKQNKIKYKPIWIPDNEKGYIPMLYDKILTSSQCSLKQYLRLKYPYKKIIYRMNNSFQKIIRSKDANYKAI